MGEQRKVLPGSLTAEWEPWGSYDDILVDRCREGIARVAINRPAKRNAFRPQTVAELCDAFTRIRDDRQVGVVLFTGVGPAADGAHAFCAGGDQSVRGDGGYVGEDGLPRLNVLDLQRIIRSLPKVVIALVATCLGKVVSGVFVGRHRWVVGTAMMGRGEFASQGARRHPHRSPAVALALRRDRLPSSPLRQLVHARDRLVGCAKQDAVTSTA